MASWHAAQLTAQAGSMKHRLATRLSHALARQHMCLITDNHASCLNIDLPATGPSATVLRNGSLARSRSFIECHCSTRNMRQPEHPPKQGMSGSPRWGKSQHQPPLHNTSQNAAPWAKQHLKLAAARQRQACQLLASRGCGSCCGTALARQQSV